MQSQPSNQRSPLQRQQPLVEAADLEPIPPDDVSPAALQIALNRLSFNEIAPMRPVSRQWNEIIERLVEMGIQREDGALTIVVQNGERPQETSLKTSTEQSLKKFNELFFVENRLAYEWKSPIPETIGKVVVVDISKVDNFILAARRNFSDNVTKLMVYFQNFKENNLNISQELISLLAVFPNLLRLSIWLDETSFIELAHMKRLCIALNACRHLKRLDLNYAHPLLKPIIGLHHLLSPLLTKLEHLTLGFPFEQLPPVLHQCSADRLVYLSITIELMHLNWLHNDRWNNGPVLAHLKHLQLHITQVDYRRTAYKPFLGDFPSLEHFSLKVTCLENKLMNMNGHFFRALCRDIRSNAPQLYELTLQGIAPATIMYPTQVSMPSLTQVTITMPAHYDFFAYFASIVQCTCQPDPLIYGMFAQSLIGLLPRVEVVILIGHATHQHRVLLHVDYHFSRQTIRVGRQVLQVLPLIGEYGLNG